MTLDLRLDPWEPEYGASVELELELDEPVGLDLEVEVSGSAWEPIASPDRAELPCCAFVDGVRRIEARLFARDDEVEGPGLFGSWAVGCARSTHPPRVDSVEVGRELVLGSGLSAEAFEFTVGSHELSFGPRSVAGSGPLDPLRGLQNAMREAEARLAQACLEQTVELVVCDGPLSYFAAGPAVGMIKRQSRSYLDPDRAEVIARLRPGERTPIFGLGEQRLERYSWYLRLAEPRSIHGPLAGIVRLEVAALGGLEGAQALAGLSGAVLPRFASQPGRDPRAPQNLYPVGALEMRLRARLGDPTLIRRGIEIQLLGKQVAVG